MIEPIDWNTFLEGIKSWFPLWAPLLLTFIEISPIKLNPIKSLCKWWGKIANAELIERIITVEKRQEEGDRTRDENQISYIRKTILDFSKDIRHGEKKTKEEFDLIHDLHNQYERLLKRNNKSNGTLTLAYDYICDVYNCCLKDNKFIN